MNQIPCTIERLTEPDKLLIGTRWPLRITIYFTQLSLSYISYILVVLQLMKK